MREAGIKDVAKRANVGISTVSRVLNDSAGVSDELKKRVLEAASEIGYTINPIGRTLKSGRTNTIAILVTSLRRNFFIDIVEGVRDYFREHNYEVHILETQDSVEEEIDIINTLVQQWIDGIILVSSVFEVNDKTKAYLDSLSTLKKKGIPIPVVQLEFPCLNPYVDSVVVDHENTAYNAVTHLAEIGRKRIAHITMPEQTVPARHRMKGYCRALKSAGLRVDDSLVVNGRYEVIDGYNSMKQLLEKKVSVDAVFASNDQMAAGALFACQEMGYRVPEDIAIIGNDSVALSVITTPALSTVSVPKYRYGQAAAGLLLERIKQPKEMTSPGEIITINTGVVIRESTLKSAKKSLEFMMIE